MTPGVNPHIRQPTPFDRATKQRFRRHKEGLPEVNPEAPILTVKSDCGVESIQGITLAADILDHGLLVLGAKWLR